MLTIVYHSGFVRFEGLLRNSCAPEFGIKVGLQPYVRRGSLPFSQLGLASLNAKTNIFHSRTSRLKYEHPGANLQTSAP
ncbi:hypothetical protein ACJ72_00027 [Emergomyces africanus]|uniref:Uncharacterized protein n=1 Tax=Emergomyces africanus TaxID=1955775 RepID=A0A1B7P9D6_9EURO|nr:hypothetical protein ACJ72_00027 [Emergomyces africanus]